MREVLTLIAIATQLRTSLGPTVIVLSRYVDRIMLVLYITTRFEFDLLSFLTSIHFIKQPSPCTGC